MARKVFVETTDPRKMAYFGWQDKRTALWGVKQGYKKAADDLVEIALQRGDNATLDTYVFPILFLYRHSLEISLKLIYFTCHGKVPLGHELDDLWRKVLDEVIDAASSGTHAPGASANKSSPLRCRLSGIDIGELGEIFDELQNTDKNSDVWRYLVNDKQALFFTEGHQIDYVNMRETLTHVFDELDYIYEVISQDLTA
jgi:hypothetical protein